MEKFYLERPSLERKTEAIEYIDEFIQNNSEIHGVDSINKYLENYESKISSKNLYLEYNNNYIKR